MSTKVALGEYLLHTQNIDELDVFLTLERNQGRWDPVKKITGGEDREWGGRGRGSGKVYTVLIL